MYQNQRNDKLCKGKRFDGKKCLAIGYHNGYCQWHGPKPARLPNAKVIKSVGVPICPYCQERTPMNSYPQRLPRRLHTKQDGVVYSRRQCEHCDEIINLRVERVFYTTK